MEGATGLVATYGMRLVILRLWVQIPVLYIGWTFFHINF